MFFVLKAIFAVFVAACCLVFVYALMRSPVFFRGERYEFYRGTSSEEIVCASSPFEKLLLPKLAGESVRYDGDRAEELIARFHAQVLFIEEAAGVLNYYCYSPELGRAIDLNGKSVNLHIAVNQNKTAAGTPVIFGGF